MSKDIEVIDVEPIHTRVVVCSYCGQKNRILLESKTLFRCGKCKHLLHRISRFRLLKERIISLGHKFRPLTMSPKYFLPFACLTLLGGLAYWGSGSVPKRRSPGPEARPTQSPTNPSPPEYVQPPLDPYGHPWPIKAGYLSGARKANTRGYSSVDVDNSGNDSAVHAKLVCLSLTGEKCVREFFLPGHSIFTVPRIAPGSYEVRCRMLGTGSLSKTEKFDLAETREDDGIRYSTVRLTLYTVPNGNMHTYGITPHEFFDLQEGEEELPANPGIRHRAPEKEIMARLDLPPSKREGVAA
jgi:hypothetical protein